MSKYIEDIKNKYTDLDYLYNCTHGRLIEIINELLNELDAFNGVGLEPDIILPEEWADKILFEVAKEGEGVSLGKLRARIVLALRTAIHKG